MDEILFRSVETNLSLHFLRKNPSFISLMYRAKPFSSLSYKLLFLVAPNYHSSKCWLSCFSEHITLFFCLCSHCWGVIFVWIQCFEQRGGVRRVKKTSDLVDLNHNVLNQVFCRLWRWSGGVRRKWGRPVFFRTALAIIKSPLLERRKINPHLVRTDPSHNDSHEINVWRRNGKKTYAV